MVVGDVEMAQLSLLVEANVSVTEPELISAAEGRYWAVNVVAEGEKVPVPLVDHSPVVPAGLIVPVSGTDVTAGQNVCTGGPALATGNGSTTTLVVPGGPVQPFTVTVTLYTPASAAVALFIDGFCWAEVNPLGPVHA